MTSVRLFRDMKRTDKAPMKYEDTDYGYLNRSARPEANKVRNLLEEWFSCYPRAEQQEFYRRFISKREHQPAFFELFLHELLRRLGCSIDIHPNIIGSQKKPDYFVQSPNGDHFYLEACVATGETNESAAAKVRKGIIYDAINRLESPDFFIGIETVSQSKAQIAGKRAREFLRRKLDALDYDKMVLLCKSDGLASSPRWHYKCDGWEISFFPIPKKPEARGKKGVRPIGQIGPSWFMVNSITERKSITQKATRYGNLDAPYVIAMNALQRGVDRETLLETLFGEEQLILSDTSEAEMIRAPNGAWIRPSGPVNTRVSAVFAVTRLSSCWNIPRADACLYHNPFAAKPYVSELTQLTQFIRRNNHMEFQNGKTLAEIFDLPLGWPED